MGFSLVHVINKILPTKRVDDDLRENPFNTKIGQEVVSVSENFWVRLAREGRWIFKTTPVAGKAITQSPTAFTIDTKIAPSYGFRFYPKRAVITCNVDALLTVNIMTGIQFASNSDQYFNYQAFVKAGTPHFVNFDGEIWCEGNSIVPNGVGITCQAQTNTAGAIMWSSIEGIEVALDA